MNKRVSVEIMCICILIFLLTLCVSCKAGQEKDSQVNVYNELDASKNLLLRFLNDEVPIVNFSKEGDRNYYSDIADKNVRLDDEKFYIVDMDGDGIDEFGYYRYPMLDIIKYDKEADSFELWLSVKEQQKPIGEGEMYAIITSQPMIYEYYLYNKNAELIESDYYRTGEELNKDNDTVTVIYEINGESVSAEEWEKETEYFFDRKEASPVPITYQELLK